MRGMSQGGKNSHSYRHLIFVKESRSTYGMKYFHKMMLWNIILTRQKGATLVCAEKYYSNYLRVAAFFLLLLLQM